MTARLRIFAGIDQYVRDDFLEADGVALDEHLLLRQQQGDFMLTLLALMTLAFHSLTDQLYQINPIFFECNHSTCDTGHIKKVIDEPGHFLKLTIHDHLEFLLRFLSRIPAFQYFQCITNRR